MGARTLPRPAEEVKLFCGVLSADEAACRTAEALLEELFGPVDVRTEPVPFVWTRYYNAEMGERILRHFVGFEGLVYPGELWRIKVLTAAKEAEHAVDGRRRFNLDPGYVTRSSVVVASTKAAGYRVYLNHGIYGQPMLLYTRGGHRALEWTYADYRDARHLDFFSALRSKYLDQLSRARPRPAAASECTGQEPQPPERCA